MNAMALQPALNRRGIEGKRSPGSARSALPDAGSGRVEHGRALRDFRLVVALTAAVAGGYCVLLMTDILSTADKALLADAILGPLAFWLVASAYTAHRRSAPMGERRWLWFMLAGAWYTVAQVVWTVDRRISHSESALSLADPFYILAVVPAAAMLLGLVPRDVGRERVRQMVGALVIASGVFYIMAWSNPDWIAIASDVPALTAAAWLALPIADTILVSLALIALTRPALGGRLPVILLAAGFICFAAADAHYAAVASGLGYIPGTWIDLGWACGFLLLATACWTPGASSLFAYSPRAVGELPGSTGSLAVFVPLLATVVVLASFAPREASVLPVASLVMFLLFGLRQALLAREMASLAAALDKSRADQLEHAASQVSRLAQTNERTIEAVSDGIFGVDSDRHVTFANKAALEMLGRDAAQIIGLRPEETFLATGREASRQQTKDPVAEALTTGMSVRGQYATFTRGDGVEFPVEWGAGALSDKGDVITGAVVVFHDITKRRAIERMKDEFVSVVSHELRTPLTSVRGSLGLLAAGAVGPLSEQGASLARRGLQNAERLTRLVDDLLDVERLESGGEVLNVVECSTAELVSAAVDGVAMIAADRSVAIRTEVIDSMVIADPGRIIQALTNLLGNAIKFSGAQTTVTVSAVPQDSAVTFVVTDTGPGIKAEDLERIFERFEQADSSDSRLQEGTGLGLAITRSIVRRHGGSIWVESTPGEGSSFHLTISAISPGRRAAPRVIKTLDHVVPADAVLQRS